MQNRTRWLMVIGIAIATSGILTAGNECLKEVRLCGNPGNPCVIALYLDTSNQLQVDRSRVFVGPSTSIQWTTKEGTSGDTFSIDFPAGATPYADGTKHFDGHKGDNAGKQTNHACADGHTDCGCYRVYKYTATLTINGQTRTIDPDVIIDPGGGPKGPRKTNTKTAQQKKTGQ